MASARRSTGARLTFIKHSLTLVCAAHLHGLEPNDTVLALGARLVHARARLARAELAKPVQNVTKGSGQWKICGARRRKNTFIIGGGGGMVVQSPLNAWLHTCT